MPKKKKISIALRNIVCAYAFIGLGALPFSTVYAATTGTTSATTTPTQVGSDLTDTNLGGANQNTAIGSASGDAEVDNTGNGGCPNSALISKKLISSTCWTCIFPIITLGVPLGASKSDAPSDRYENPFCICYDRNNVPYFGFTYGLWQPTKAIELVRIPGCIVTFDGLELGFSKLDMGGTTNNNATQKDDLDYHHFHMFSYPLLIVLEMFQSTDCMKDKYMDFDILYLSEVDPTWSNAEIGFFTNPEIVLFANPVALTACYADAVSSSLFKRPINSLFWCAGSWGGIYPFFCDKFKIEKHPNYALLEDSAKENAYLLSDIHTVTAQSDMQDDTDNGDLMTEPAEEDGTDKKDSKKNKDEDVEVESVENSDKLAFNTNHEHRDGQLINKMPMKGPDPAEIESDDKVMTTQQTNLQPPYIECAEESYLDDLFGI